MNPLTANQPLTMTSVEFLDNVINPARESKGENKVRYNDFFTKVKDELEPNHDELFVMESTGGRSRRVMNLNEDQMMLVGMRESKVVRKSVLAKIKELTSDQPKVPTNFAEALQLAADQAKALELAAPKVAFVDNFVEVGTTKTLRETAKILKYPERKMIALMLEDKVLYRQSGNLLPYQARHDQGLFEVKTGERNGHAYTQTRVTTKGLEWLASRYASELMADK